MTLVVGSTKDRLANAYPNCHSHPPVPHSSQNTCGVRRTAPQTQRAAPFYGSRADEIKELLTWSHGATDPIRLEYSHDYEMAEVGKHTRTWLRDPLNDGVGLERRVSCHHGNFAVKRISFEGTNLGRRCLGCGGGEDGYCDFVEWVDPIWAPTLRNAIDELWRLFHEEAQARAEAEQHNRVLCIDNAFLKQDKEAQDREIKELKTLLINKQNEFEREKQDCRVFWIYYKENKAKAEQAKLKSEEQKKKLELHVADLQNTLKNMTWA